MRAMGNEKKFFGYKAAIGAFLIIFANLGACTTLGHFWQVYLPTANIHWAL